VTISGLRRTAAAGGWAALLALAGCATPSHGLPTDANGRLFAQSFGEISDLYIRPISSESLAVAGLGSFHRLDPELGVTETPGGDSQIVLLDNRRELVALPAPPTNDAVDWGELIGRAIGRFRAVSPRLAALSDNDIDKAVFNGVTGVLDRFSRYAAPGAAREQRAARDGFGGTIRASEDGGIAVFRVSGFNQDTVRQLAEQLKAAQQRGGSLRGIVLDLRDNPGGLLDQAVGMADLFIAKGPLVAAVGRNPASHQYYAASGHAIAPDVRLAVLVNGGSASSSEIVAAALQDSGRAVVIGSASYGKGTVQTVLRLPNDGELTLTWAMLITPSGYFLHHHGVVPTLCTSDLRDDPAALAQGLRRAGSPASLSPLAARPRAALDEAAWRQLRLSCPQRADDNPIDVKLAAALLDDPALYRQAVHAIGPSPHLAAATVRALTGPGAALSSDQPVP
jgi:hypothetical protein